MRVLISLAMSYEIQFCILSVRVLLTFVCSFLDWAVMLPSAPAFTWTLDPLIITSSFHSSHFQKQNHAAQLHSKIVPRDAAEDALQPQQSLQPKAKASAKRSLNLQSKKSKQPSTCTSYDQSQRKASILTFLARHRKQHNLHFCACRPSSAMRSGTLRLVTRSSMSTQVVDSIPMTRMHTSVCTTVLSSEWHCPP